MKRRIWSGIIMVLIMLIAWLWLDDKKRFVSHSAIDGTPNSHVTESIPQSVIAQPEPADLLEAVAEQNPYRDEAIKAQLMQIADLYAETAKYPHFSQPITHPDQAKEFKPFEKTEVDMPFPVEGLSEPIVLSAAVDKYQYFSGDPIGVRLKIAGAPVDTFVSAVATIAGPQGDTTLVKTMNPGDATLTRFITKFDTTLVSKKTFSDEMFVKIQVVIGEQILFTTVGFRYQSASAQLVGVGNSSPEGEYLNIPLQYNVFIPGYYFFSGVLEDQASGQALLKLQTEGRMAQGNGLLILQAHIQALKAAGSEGPYILRRINTYRGSEPGEKFNAPASSAQKRYEVSGYPFSQYDDIEYKDELVTQRLEFLQNLGSLKTQEDETANVTEPE